MRPALKWYGGKNKIASWVISHFPQHTCYVEPFGGAASVLLHKQKADHEVYNDLDGELVNFFRVLREDTARLMALIELTPFSREEHRQAWQVAADPLERARRFYVRCWQSWGAGTHATPGAAGWQTQKSTRRGTTAVEGWRDIGHLATIANRLLGVQIENDNALDVIDRFDTQATLFYVDPPYLASTRNKSRAYRHELSDEQHHQLADRLQAVQGMVVLSGYENLLYSRLYRGWQKVTISTTNRNCNSVQEVLWLSPNATRLDLLPLFRWPS